MSRDVSKEISFSASTRQLKEDRLLETLLVRETAFSELY